MIIGAVGIGAMGTPMARNLVADGDRVLVYDIDRAKAEAIAGNAITLADSVAAMAAECELIVTMVSDDAALGDVVFGPAGVLREPDFKGCLADLSTTSVDLALDVGAALAAAGATFIDGGVIGGGVPAARAGTSPIVLAGDKTLVERLMPVFERLGECDYVGVQGNAKVVKIINNLLVGVITAANAEALSLGLEAGPAPGGHGAEPLQWLGRFGRPLQLHGPPCRRWGLRRRPHRPCPDDEGHFARLSGRGQDPLAHPLRRAGASALRRGGPVPGPPGHVPDHLRALPRGRRRRQPSREPVPAIGTQTVGPDLPHRHGLPEEGWDPNSRAAPGAGVTGRAIALGDVAPASSPRTPPSVVIRVRASH